MVLFRRPDHDWPILLAAIGTGVPGRYWHDRPGVFGLKDGSLALNGSGVVAAVLPSGTIPGPRPVGELALDALDFADARDAVEALRDLNPAAYQPFTLVLADNRDAFVISRWNESRLTVEEIQPGRLNLGGLADPFSAPGEPEPARSGWIAWRDGLATISPDCALIALPSIALFGTPPIWDQAIGGVWHDMSCKLS